MKVFIFFKNPIISKNFLMKYMTDSLSLKLFLIKFGSCQLSGNLLSLLKIYDQVSTERIFIFFFYSKTLIYSIFFRYSLYSIHTTPNSIIFKKPNQKCLLNHLNPPKTPLKNPKFLNLSPLLPLQAKKRRSIQQKSVNFRALTRNLSIMPKTFPNTILDSL